MTGAEYRALQGATAHNAGLSKAARFCGASRKWAEHGPPTRRRLLAPHAVASKNLISPLRNVALRLAAKPDLRSYDI
jgi:hypothetical protein